MQMILTSLDCVMTIFVFLLLISALLSWMVAFSIIKVDGVVSNSLGEIVFRVTEPVLRPVRGLLPSTSGMDISPVILALGLLVGSRVLREIASSFFSAY